MGHKYVKRDGEWQMMFRYGDSTTVIRTCPKCQFSQPLDTMMLGIINFKNCPKCGARLDLPKKLKY